MSTTNVTWPEGSTPGTEAQAIINAARHGVPPTVIDPDKVYAFVGPDGDVTTIDGRKNREDRPARKSGTVEVFDAESLAAYVREHDEGDGETKVWANETKFDAIAVINGHGRSLTGYGDHRAHLALTPTEQWIAWVGRDGQMMSQVAFAEHVEDNVADIIQPIGAEMLEVAQSLQAHSRVDFKSTNYLANGQRSLKFEETIDAKAGPSGTLTVPGEFTVALKPFVGSAPYSMVARFRFRINGGNLQIGYKLTRPADVQRAAFTDVISEVRDGLDGTGIAILNGTPSR